MAIVIVGDLVGAMLLTLCFVPALHAAWRVVLAARRAGGLQVAEL